MKPEDHCPCGSGLALESCCGRYLESHHLPDTAERLMRSRYTAYVLLREAYLLETWHPRTRPEALAFDPSARWQGLDVLRVERGGVGDSEGVVEFTARYKIGGRAYRMREESCFVHEGKMWLYVDARN